MVPGLTDTHCHLNHPDFDDDREEVISRALAAGVERLLVIGYDLASSRFAVEIAKSHDVVQAVIGIHPESAFEWNSQTEEILQSLIDDSAEKVVGWGEIGLDYHWETMDRQHQKQVFVAQLDLARQADLPVVIHCRDAYQDVIDILRDQQFSRAVLHCFTGTMPEAEKAIEIGLFIGVGGIATFKKSDAVREVAKAVPLDRILLETDAPYLAPQQWRGKRNEPAYIESIARLVADVRGITPEQIANATSLNASKLFGSMR